MIPHRETAAAWSQLSRSRSDSNGKRNGLSKGFQVFAFPTSRVACARVPEIRAFNAA
jgi:hypothetical protein